MKDFTKFHESLILHDFDDEIYNLPDDSISSEEFLSEKMDEFTNSLKEPLERQIKAVESIADSANKTASKADVKGWISVIIAGLCAFMEFAVHHQEIFSFIRSLSG